MLYLPNGIGETTGDDLVTLSPLQMSGNVWYVSSETGTDGSSPAGLNPQVPLATLAQAQTNASNYDVVVLLDDHDETLTGALTITKSLTIVGAGTASGVPRAKLTLNAASGNLLTITGARVTLGNIYFPMNDQSNSDPRIAASGAQLWVRDCYFECGANDQDAALLLSSGADQCRLTDTTFISTVTTSTTLPVTGILTGAALSDLELDGLILSAGTYGFSNPYAMDASTAAITNLKGARVSLLLGADIKLHTSTTGRMNVSTATGTGNTVTW